MGRTRIFVLDSGGKYKYKETVQHFDRNSVSFSDDERPFIVYENDVFTMFTKVGSVVLASDSPMVKGLYTDAVKEEKKSKKNLHDEIRRVFHEVVEQMSVGMSNTQEVCYSDTPHRVERDAQNDALFIDAERTRRQLMGSDSPDPEFWLSVGRRYMRTLYKIIYGYTHAYNADNIRVLSCRVADLLVNKRLDYGDKNITDFGTLGIRVRMVDKLYRIKNMATNGVHHTNESLEDAFTDMIGYSLVAYLYTTHRWSDDQMCSTPNK